MIANIFARSKRMPAQVLRCLRHYTDHVLELISRFPSRMSIRGNKNDTSSAWRGSWLPVLRRVGDIVWVAVLYLASELLVWGLSLALRDAGLQFLSSIVGMVLVFSTMALIQQIRSGSDGFYHRNIKSKIDFINNNLGLGFPVPIVTISRENLLGGGGIGRVIGNFLNTNLIFWILALLLSWSTAAVMMRAPAQKIRNPRKNANVEAEQAWRSSARPPSPPRLEIPTQRISRRPSETTTLNGTTVTGYHTDKEAGLAPESRTASAYFTDSECSTSVPPPPEVGHRRQGSLPECAHKSEEKSIWSGLAKEYYPTVLALFSLVVVGIPVSRCTGDDRILDGCMMWLTWITSTIVQRAFRRSNLLTRFQGTKTATATMLNPVLLTTLAMTAYTRAKAAATHTPIENTLAMFSGGTSLADLWALRVMGWSLIQGRSEWFGAGDAALSTLECGIVVWGFKLYECRRQIWSRAGAAVVVLSVGIAALNVFLSVLLGSAVGLAGPEALAFAARSTTLALAKPAMEALQGNQVVNAALVVSNGILGQLMYPFLLCKLGIEEKQDETEEGREKDDAVTIGAGTAIGINGAAMGVAYLYERKSRAAPYAALSMTVFGVMTVVFTAVPPFTGTLASLANGK